MLESYSILAFGAATVSIKVGGEASVGDQPLGLWGIVGRTPPGAPGFSFRAAA